MFLVRQKKKKVLEKECGLITLKLKNKGKALF